MSATEAPPELAERLRLADQIAGETLVTLKAVAGRFPSQRGDGSVSIWAVRRWADVGVPRGNVLGTTEVGGTVYTSEEELARWRRRKLIAKAKAKARRLNPGPPPAKAARDHAAAKARNDARFEKRVAK